MRKIIAAIIVLCFVILGLYFILNTSEIPQVSEDQLESLLAPKKKVLYVDSYHPELPWVEGITNGIINNFKIKRLPSGQLDKSTGLVDLRIIHMDTKRNQSESYIKQAALDVKSVIESWNPDVVIASDDNASKYLIAPYYKDSKIPFVFCGVNWDEKVYGFPYANVTGMVEVQLIPDIIKNLEPYAKGKRIGYLKGDSLSSRKECEHFEKILNSRINKHFVKNFSEWRREFLKLQTEVDMLLIGNLGAIADWDGDQKNLNRFVHENTKIPIGTWDKSVSEMALVTLATIPEEQGEWAAQSALKILKGKSPRNIPIVRNRKAAIYINMAMANKLGIKFPIKLLEHSNIVGISKKKILFVDSYHRGYQWSDSVTRGVLKALNAKLGDDDSVDSSESKVNLRIVRMDTKRNRSESFKKRAGIRVRRIIEEWKPDVVIASDDNASKYLVVPYYKDAKLPFVFCGLNWDASNYGYPYTNVTGMIEVAPLLQTIEVLKAYAKGNRVGYLGVNAFSEQKNIQNYKKILNAEFDDGKLVNTFSEWKNAFLSLQDSVDMLIWINHVGIAGWSDDEAIEFVQNNSKIPLGTISENNAHFVLMGVVKIPEEQGEWAAQAAKRILDGELPENIPIVMNRRSRFILNMKLAKKLGINFPEQLIKEAKVIGDH